MALCRFFVRAPPWQDLPTHYRAYQSGSAFSSLAQSSLIGAALQGLAATRSFRMFLRRQLLCAPNGLRRWRDQEPKGCKIMALETLMLFPIAIHTEAAAPSG